ncbi:hypothetical protein J6590_058887 [Homalodisca vitripennis]|nr:hypothetical protein J6590_058887 [Homalodisca vitripennis]
MGNFVFDCNGHKMPSRPQDSTAVPAIQANVFVSGTSIGPGVQLFPELSIRSSVHVRHEKGSSQMIYHPGYLTLTYFPPITLLEAFK